MFKLVAEILGSNDWMEEILVVKHPTYLYQFSLITIKDFSCKQSIYATLNTIFWIFALTSGEIHFS